MKKLNLSDKIYIPVILALVTWAGAQLIEVERMEEKVKHLEQETHGNREAIQGLIELHLKQ